MTRTRSSLRRVVAPAVPAVLAWILVALVAGLLVAPAQASAKPSKGQKFDTAVYNLDRDDQSQGSVKLEAPRGWTLRPFPLPGSRPDLGVFRNLDLDAQMVVYTLTPPKSTVRQYLDAATPTPDKIAAGTQVLTRTSGRVGPDRRRVATLVMARPPLPGSTTGKPLITLISWVGKGRTARFRIVVTGYVEDRALLTKVLRTAVLSVKKIR